MSENQPIAEGVEPKKEAGLKERKSQFGEQGEMNNMYRDKLLQLGHLILYDRSLISKPV